MFIGFLAYQVSLGIDLTCLRCQAGFAISYGLGQGPRWSRPSGGLCPARVPPGAAELSGHFNPVSIWTTASICAPATYPASISLRTRTRTKTRTETKTQTQTRTKIGTKTRTQTRARTKTGAEPRTEIRYKQFAGRIS